MGSPPTHREYWVGIGIGVGIGIERTVVISIYKRRDRGTTNHAEGAEENNANSRVSRDWRVSQSADAAGWNRMQTLLVRGS